MRIKFIFAWYDLWIGFFWDSKNRYLYFFPIPTIGLIFKFRRVCKGCGKKFVDIPYSWCGLCQISAYTDMNKDID